MYCSPVSLPPYDDCLGEIRSRELIRQLFGSSNPAPESTEIDAAAPNLGYTPDSSSSSSLTSRLYAPTPFHPPSIEAAVPMPNSHYFPEESNESPASPLAILQNIAGRIVAYQFPKVRLSILSYIKLDLNQTTGSLQDVLDCTFRLLQKYPVNRMSASKEDFFNDAYYDNFQLKPNYPSNMKTRSLSLLLALCDQLSVSNVFHNVRIVEYQGEANCFLVYHNHLPQVHRLWRKAQLMKSDKTGTKDLVRLSGLSVPGGQRNRDTCLAMKNDFVLSTGEFCFWVCVAYVFVLFLDTGDWEPYHWCLPDTN